MPSRRQPKRPKRKKGRPQKDMPAVGRDTLIAATRKLVRTIPPGQITRLDIARAAGVDPALIRYYFGNKEELLVAAVLEAGKDLRSRMRQNTAQADSPADKLRRRMVTLLEILYEDPSLHHLIIERIIHNYSKQTREFRHDMVFGACKELASIIEQGVETGEMARVDPRHLFLAMIGACSFPTGERALFDELMGKAATRADLEAYTHFVTELFVNGLAAMSGKRKSKRALETLLERADS
jgi:AcrR family transcriptional regulator